MSEVPPILVVIAKFDDRYIDRCLASLGDKYPIKIIDTSSGGHPTGAYIKAYKEYPAKNYLFMQDSMFALQPDYVEPFASQDADVVAWTLFRQGFDTAEQEAWATEYYKSDYPGVGIFGPVFYTSRKVMQKLDEMNLLPPIPKNKAEAQTTERMWSWAVYKAGLTLGSAAGFWDKDRMITGTFPIFRKIFGNRD